MEIKGTKILIIGGGGNIGSHIADAVIKEGVKELIIIDSFVGGRGENLKWAIANGNVVLVKGDIRDRELLKKYCEGVDYIFHQAAIRINQCQEDPNLCKEILIDGTFNVFDAAVKAKVKKVVFASSASVYGEPSYLPMDEKHPLNNKTFYGAAKIVNEELAKAFREKYGMNYIGLRYFNVYGPRMDIYGHYTSVMIKWLDKIDNNDPPVIFGNGEQSMDFIYIEDIVSANILALKSDVNEGIYNVGTGVETSLNDLVKQMLNITNPKLNPEYKESKELIIVSKRKAGIEKAKKEIGFEAKIDLETGLKNLIEWRKEKYKI
jgi:UDP-glucose 4-epimerase